MLDSDSRTIERPYWAHVPFGPRVGGATAERPKEPAVVQTGIGAAAIPAYLRDVYTWAYINPRNVRFFEHRWVIDTILWGNSRRLQRALFDELQPGWHVLQAGCVYGDLSPNVLRYLGPGGYLEAIDVVPIQVDNCRRKIGGNGRACVRRADAAAPGGGPYDAVVCYFLLHELPDDYKRQVVNSLLSTIKPGGKVVFIDYHKPHPAHPLKGIVALVFALLEPFADSVWRRRIASFASRADGYLWRTETYFGGLFQKTVARRPLDTSWRRDT